MASENPNIVLVVCPHCDTLNRLPRAKLEAGGKCGQCGKLLFEGRPLPLDAARFERHGASHLRFVDQPHLQRLIVQAGLAPVAFYGDWDKSPLRPESPEIIAVTTLA